MQSHVVERCAPNRILPGHWAWLNYNSTEMTDSVRNFRKELLHAGKGEAPSFQKNSKVVLYIV